jgi:hypothetical protein
MSQQPQWAKASSLSRIRDRTQAPQNIKKLDTKHIFKNKVKKFLLQNVFYSVDEYLLS